MLSFNLPDVVKLSKEIGRIVQYLNDKDKDEDLPEETGGSYKKTFSRYKIIFEELDLKMCALHCGRLASYEGKKFGDIAKLLDELYGRLIDECGLRSFFCLSIRDSGFALHDTPLFGADVQRKFPSAAFEIEEAGKCLGFGRSTASVFHLMRTLEIAILAVSRCLSIPDPIKPGDRNWGHILSQSIKPELDARTGKKGGKLWTTPSDKQFFEGAYASLDAVRAAWRNTTMHVENKYTDDEAEHIYVAVRGLMKKLASRMDEQGMPQA